MTTSFSKSLKTEIYRKAVHLSSLWMPLFIFLSGKNICILFFLFTLLGNLILEYAAYKKTPVIGGMFRRMFFKTLRPKEVIKNKFVPSGSVYILLAALICSVCYAKEAAAIALTVMLIADSGAALCGKLFGSFRFENGKSLEGTATFFILTLFILSLLAPECPLPLMTMTAVSATAAEFFENELSLDDNLSIPLVVGYFLNLLYL